MKKSFGLFVMASLPVFLALGCSNKSTGPAGSIQSAVNLNSAANYAVLAYTQITNSGPTSLCGDLGLSPGTSAGGGWILTCGGVAHVTDTAAAAAKLDLTTAYNDAAGRTSPALGRG